MTAWILVVLIAIAIITRYFRSKKLLLILVISAFSGLVVGMMGRESVVKIKKYTIDSTTQVKPEVETSCTQFLLATDNIVIANDCQSGTVSYNDVSCDKLHKGITKSYLTKGRDQPSLTDTS